MKVGHIEIFVSSPTAAREFYERALGFEVAAVQGDQFVWLTNHGREFLLRPTREAPAAKSYRESAMAIVLYCSDLERTMAELVSRGVTFAGTDGSEKCPTFTDPDGNWFQLVDPNDH